MRPRRILNAYKQVQSKPVVQYTPEEALCFLLDTNMTRDAYVRTRKGAKKRNANIYPSYHKILAAKKESYPDDIKISDTGL